MYRCYVHVSIADKCFVSMYTAILYTNAGFWGKDKFSTYNH